MKNRVWTLLLTLLMMMMMTSRTKATSSNAAVDARLVNGHHHCAGHLEMKHQKQWRTMMLINALKHFRTHYAEMACQQMGCGSVVSLQFLANTTIPRPAWEVHFPCRGRKLTIRECRDAASRQKVADVESTVSSTIVECSEYLRLSTFIPCSGKVLVKSNDRWVHVCKAQNNKNEEAMAEMMCAELGCGLKRSVRYSTSEEYEESRIIQCHGNETQIQQCSSSELKNCSRALQIDCEQSFSVRLNGKSRCRGALEGKTGAEWRPLMPSWFSLEPIQFTVICKELGCGSFISTTSQYHSQRLPIWELDRLCENRDFCKRWNSDEGEHTLNMACAEALRLTYGLNRCSGQVGVKHGGAWFSLCQDEFSLRHSFIGCREAECGFPQVKQIGRSRVKQNTTVKLNCSGDEERLTDCPVSSLPAEGGDDTCLAAFLSCGTQPMAPEITMFSRLMTVEQKTLSANRGHRVVIICSVDSTAKVKAFELTTENGENRNLPAVDNSAQFVFEQVEQNQAGRYFCRYDYEFSPDSFSKSSMLHLSVKDASYVRLVGQESRCFGVLELQHEDEWRPVSQRRWSLKEAAVVCRQLDCGSVIRSDSHSTELQSVWRFYSDCDGSERALLSCGSVRPWISSDAVHVLCSDIVAPLTVTVLADRLYPENTERVVVHEGQSFFVNCAVEPRFPGGYFSVAFFGSEMNKAAEAALNYSAVFKFSDVNRNHSGNYSCIYHNHVSQHDFTFESKTVSVTVGDLGEIKLDDGRQRDDGSKACSGTLHLSNGTSQMQMVTVEGSVWDMKHASIVCRQLDCGNAVSTSKIQLQTFRSMWRFFSDCEGSEAALLVCGDIDRWFSDAAVQVVCAGQS